VRGLIAACEQQAAEAMQAFDRAAACEPQNAAHWHALGSMHRHTADSEAALRAWDRALQEDPDDSVALMHSVDALCALGRQAEAESRLVRVLQIDANHALALRYMADMQMRMGRAWGKDGKHVTMLLQRALRLAPQAPDIHASLAYYYGLAGESARGLALLQHFTEQHPHAIAGWYYVARWHARFGDIRAAADAIFYADTLRQNCTARPHALSTLDSELQYPDVLRPLVVNMLNHLPRHWQVWTTAGQVILPTSSDREGI
jgi:predicted Zn-dependent protease